MPDPPNQFECDTCDQVVAKADAIRTEPIASIDPNKWQTFCCPTCGRRLETVFVGLE